MLTTNSSSKELHGAHPIFCPENSPLFPKRRSFGDALIAKQSRYNLEYCNNVTNAAGRRARGFWGAEVLARSDMSVFSGDLPRTCVPEDVPQERRR